MDNVWRAVPVPETAPGSPCTFPSPTVNGGAPGEVAPALRGQYINEIVAGFQYDVGLDMVLGIAYTHRDLGNIAIRYGNLRSHEASGLDVGARARR